MAEKKVTKAAKSEADEATEAPRTKKAAGAKKAAGKSTASTASTSGASGDAKSAKKRTSKPVKRAAKAPVKGSVARATLNQVRISPRKARLVVDLIRGAKVETALDVLANCDKKTAPLVKKLLLSAVANAGKNSGVDVDELYVKSAWVDEGRKLYRMMPRAQGRATPIRKRYSHITVILDEANA